MRVRVRPFGTPSVLNASDVQVVSAKCVVGGMESEVEIVILVD